MPWPPRSRLCAALVVGCWLQLGCGPEFVATGQGGSAGGPDGGAGASDGGAGGGTAVGGMGGTAGSGGADGGSGGDKLVFVTTLAAEGGTHLGLEGADAVCQEEAQTAGLGGAWVAWLSARHGSVDTNARDRLVSNGPWLRMDGELVFANRNEISGGPLVPINRDPSGTEIVTPPFAVWTGTYASGQASGVDCLEWHSSATSAQGSAGVLTETIGRWTADTAIACALLARLYCFEQ